MVEKFKQILTKLKEKGDVSLFVVLKMDDFVDKWSIVICADWATAGDPQAFNDVVDIVDSLLNTEEQESIARIGIFSKNDYIPQLFSKYKAGEKITHETKINGFIIYEGYILESPYEKEKTQEDK